jgi:YD repeat-containing protein
MKNFFLFALMGILAFSACKKDENAGFELKNTTLSLTPNDSGGSVITIEFTSATAFTGNKGGTAVSGTYTFVDGTLTLTFVNGDTITLTKEGDKFTSSGYTVDAIDNPDNNTDNPGKDSNSGIVSSIKIDDRVFTFTYDAQGRISQIKSTKGTFAYSYSGNTVTINTTTGGDNMSTLILQTDAQGRMVSATAGTGEDKEDFTASYDANGYVKQTTYSYNLSGITTITSNCVWTDGNLTSIQEAHTYTSNYGYNKSYSNTHTYVYETTPAKGNFDIASIMANRMVNEFVWAFGFLGKTSSTLLTSFTEQDEDYVQTATYAYKLNSNGYVTEMTCTTSDRSNSSKPRITIVTVEYQ